MRKSYFKSLSISLLILFSFTLIEAFAKTPKESDHVLSNESKPIEPSREMLEKAIVKNTPAGYSVMHTEIGHINLDQIEDAVVILKKSDEPKGDEKRPMLLFIGLDDNRYEIAKKNEKTVKCRRCGGAAVGDPFEGVTIKRGYFSIHYYGGSAWRWLTEITFKYNQEKNDWFLHNIETQAFNAFEPDKTTEKTIKTTKDFGNIPFEEFESEWDL